MSQKSSLPQAVKSVSRVLMSDSVDIDTELVRAVAKAGLHERFSKLRGADLIYACIAALEDAPLVTVDKHFAHIDGLKVVLLGDAAPMPRKPISIKRGAKTHDEVVLAIPFAPGITPRDVVMRQLAPALLERAS